MDIVTSICPWRKLQRIDELLPDAPPFWGYALAQYTQKIFSMIRAYPEDDRFVVWDRALPVHKAIRLWSQYESATGKPRDELLRALRINPLFFPRLEFTEATMQTLACNPLVAFLSYMSQALQQYLRMQRGEADFPMYCCAIARTMGANLLYTNSLGFPLTPEEIGHVYVVHPDLLNDMPRCICNLLRTFPFDMIPRYLFNIQRLQPLVSVFFVVASILFILNAQ